MSRSCRLDCCRSRLCRLTKIRARSVFFFNDTATTEIYTLSLHDALPICLIDAVMDAYRVKVSELGLEAETKARGYPLFTTHTFTEPGLERLPMGSWKTEYYEDDDDDDPYDDGPHPYSAWEALGFWPVVDDPGEQKDIPRPIHEPPMSSPLDGDDLYRYNALPAPAREGGQKNIKEYIRQASRDKMPDKS